jgi:hypothetical protein
MAMYDVAQQSQSGRPAVCCATFADMHAAICFATRYMINRDTDERGNVTTMVYHDWAWDGSKRIASISASLVVRIIRVPDDPERWLFQLLGGEYLRPIYSEAWFGSVEQAQESAERFIKYLRDESIVNIGDV